MWRSASILPVIGNDFAATRIATDALDALASDVLPSLTDAANTMQKAGLANADGNLNVKTLTEVSSKISKSNDTLQRQVTALNEAPEPHIAQVRDALTGGKATLDSAASQINGVASTLDSLTALFGHEGTRNYLILSQTNAETQAAGGVVGSVGALTVNNGTISMGQFYSDSKFDLTAPVTSTDEVDKLCAISRLPMVVTFAWPPRRRTSRPRLSMPKKCGRASRLARTISTVCCRSIQSRCSLCSV